MLNLSQTIGAQVPEKVEMRGGGVVQLVFSSFGPILNRRSLEPQLPRACMSRSGVFDPVIRLSSGNPKTNNRINVSLFQSSC